MDKQIDILFLSLINSYPDEDTLNSFKEIFYTDSEYNSNRLEDVLTLDETPKIKFMLFISFDKLNPKKTNNSDEFYTIIFIIVLSLILVLIVYFCNIKTDNLKFKNQTKHNNGLYL